jgi:hypothetical protein
MVLRLPSRVKPFHSLFLPALSASFFAFFAFFAFFRLFDGGEFRSSLSLVFSYQLKD